MTPAAKVKYAQLAVVSAMEICLIAEKMEEANKRIMNPPINGEPQFPLVYPLIFV
jgi:hypothetical protein